MIQSCKMMNFNSCLLKDMPGMMGCGDYKSLCMNPSSVVAQCDYGVPPVPKTMDVSMQVKSICAEMPSMNGCATCASTNFVVLSFQSNKFLTPNMFLETRP